MQYHSMAELAHSVITILCSIITVMHYCFLLFLYFRACKESLSYYAAGVAQLSLTGQMLE